MPKAQASRTFDVSLSSVKRYVEKAERGEPLAPKKSPGSPPEPDEKASKLLEDDLRERAPLPPFGSAATTRGAPKRDLGEPLHHVGHHSPRRPYAQKGDG
jgi:transposase